MRNGIKIQIPKGGKEFLTVINDRLFCSGCRLHIPWGGKKKPLGKFHFHMLTKTHKKMVCNERLDPEGNLSCLLCLKKKKS